MVYDSSKIKFNFICIIRIFGGFISEKLNVHIKSYKYNLTIFFYLFNCKRKFLIYGSFFTIFIQAICIKTISFLIILFNVCCDLDLVFSRIFYFGKVSNNDFVMKYFLVIKLIIIETYFLFQPVCLRPFWLF